LLKDDGQCCSILLKISRKTRHLIAVKGRRSSEPVFGRFSTKSEEIAQIKSSKCKVESDHLDDAKVRVFGDAAVFYGWETFVVKCTDK
jgi:hypothetical protein